MSRPPRPLPVVIAWSDNRTMRKTETVTELDATSTGVWWVTTQGGTIHIWNLDNGTLMRAPGRDSLAGGMRFDGTPVEVLEVGRYPRVGEGFAAALRHPTDPLRVVFRSSSDIVKIERAPR